jgi:hypothetical protein
MRYQAWLLHGALWLNVLLFALLLGGNLYEQWVIIPYWADDPPRTLQFWRELMRNGHFTFYTLTPLTILAAVIGVALGWRVSDLRSPLIVAAVSILLVLAITLLWAVQPLKELFPFELRGTGTATELAPIIRRFQIIGWVRWAILFTGFAALLRALSRSFTSEASANSAT